MKDIVLFWIQWSWKWTQAEKILEKYGDQFAYFEAGGVLRALKSTDNALWNYIWKYVNKGQMVDGSFIASLFDAFLLTLAPWQNILVDSFPRTQEQMGLFVDKMKRNNRHFLTIGLDLSEQQAIERLWSRRICNKCKRTFWVLLDPDLKKCKVCGWDLIIRHDDQPGVIKERLGIFYKDTAPVLEYFMNQWQAVKVDAARWVDEVFADVVNIIDNS